MNNLGNKYQFAKYCLTWQNFLRSSSCLCFMCPASCSCSCSCSCSEATTTTTTTTTGRAHDSWCFLLMIWQSFDGTATIKIFLLRTAIGLELHKMVVYTASLSSCLPSEATHRTYKPGLAKLQKQAPLKARHLADTLSGFAQHLRSICKTSAKHLQSICKASVKHLLPAKQPFRVSTPKSLQVLC